MSNPDEIDQLDLLILDLIQMIQLKGDDIFVFASGNLRGLLRRARYAAYVLPSSTYLTSKPIDDQLEPCIILDFIPPTYQGVAGNDLAVDLAKVKFTRNQQIFTMPVRLIDRSMSFSKIGDKQFMLNINTSIKK
jgi:hypothetical protein